jgi:hypothetical protein
MKKYDYLVVGAGLYGAVFDAPHDRTGFQPGILSGLAAIFTSTRSAHRLHSSVAALSHQTACISCAGTAVSRVSKITPQTKAAKALLAALYRLSGSFDAI